MRDRLINALDSVKLELQTAPSQKAIDKVIEKLERAIIKAQKGSMIESLAILEK